MQSLTFLNSLAALVLMAWATWCVLSPNFDDGIIGKLLLSALAVASYAVMLNPEPRTGGSVGPGVVINISMAGLAIRHWFLKQILPHIAAVFRQHFKG